MLFRTRLVVALLGAALLVGGATAAGPADSLKQGTPDLKSVGPLAFGPEGILLVGDPQGGAIFALDTGDTKEAGSGSFKVDGIDEKVAALLGTDAKQIQINDLAVNPASGNAYLSVSRGRGPDAAPVIVRVDRQGKVSEVSLKNVKFAKAALPNPPAQAKQRQEAITDLAFVDGKAIVAGLSNEEWGSNLRVIPFPFTEANKGASIGIFHGAHGRFETNSPIRTFAHYKIQGDDHLLAAYTCTPLVKVPVAQLKPGEKVKGITVAELGNRNRPLDMVVYQKGGKDYVLLANSSRGVMKISTEGINNNPGISERISGTAGQKYDTLSELKGVEQLDRLDKDQALLLVRSPSGSLSLQSITLP